MFNYIPKIAAFILVTVISVTPIMLLISDTTHTWKNILQLIIDKQ